MSGGGKFLLNVNIPRELYDDDDDDDNDDEDNHDHVNIQLDSYKGYLEQVVMWEELPA